ncbi:MAG: peptide deformylase [Firmicutes bacterium]|nr:peptide deformylase [Bacillota bacterium]
MALRSIRTDGDEILRKESKKVEKFDRRLEMLIDDMWDTMYDANGIGLAAVQVGVLKQVIVIDTGEEDEQLVLINPEIIASEGNVCEAEGCLSIPGKSGYVNRPETVTVRALDENGEPFIRTGTGLLARCMCHEIDHLHGILYTDKVVDAPEGEKA